MSFTGFRFPSGALDKMIFEFSEPYASRCAREIRFELSSPVALKHLVEKWPAALLPDEARGPEGLKEDVLLAHFLFFRCGNRVELGENVFPGDRIQVLLAATGG